MANALSPDRRDGNNELRASDADRERVADVLRQAAGDGRISIDELDDRLTATYSAKTYAELERLTRDLPTLGTGSGGPPATVVRPLPGVHTSRFAIAIMSGFQRRGDWAVASRFSALALMGGGTIDLRNAQFTDGHVAISAVAVMGGIEVIVPEEAHVDARGFAIMGGVSHRRGPGLADGPVVTVRQFALMGGVGVRRARRKARNRQPGSGEAGPPAAIANTRAGEPGQTGESGEPGEASTSPGAHEQLEAP